MAEPVDARAERYGPLVVIGVVVVGFVIRLRGLSEFWLNPDEGIYYSTLTQGSFEAFWAEVTANAHPPLFYVLLRMLGYLTWDFVWLRGVSLVFGVAAIWVFWCVGKELGGSGLRGTVTGLVSAGLLALTPAAIALSQVLRPYMLLVLLLGTALLFLLRYRREPSHGPLVAYAVSMSLAVLTHYGAVLALGALTALVAHDALWRRGEGRDAVELLAAHVLPFVVSVALYVVHVRAALGSELMAEALGPGGWLSGWLTDSPRAAWDNFVAFQSFHVPPSLRVRAALLLVSAIAIAAASGDRAVALLAGSAVAIALAASALGAYPFGESRHNAWLLVFTLPALGWLAGRLVTLRGRSAVLGAGALLLVLLGGAALERPWGTPPGRITAIRSAATEERVLRQVGLAPLVVGRLDPAGEPGTIVMTEQTYYVLMPLYPEARRDAVSSADSTSFRFGYGAREIVVVRMWDWSGADDLMGWLDRIPRALPGLAWDGEAPLLVLAGGWGSRLLSRVPELVAEGIVREQTWAYGPDPNGVPIVRMSALLVVPSAATGDGASR